MFESISSKIEKALHTLRGKGSITDINIAETVKEVRRALIDADVSYPIAKEFTDNVKAEALGRDVIQSIEPGQLMVKIVHEKLTELMGSEAVDINVKGSPAVILIAGLQGSGKTTFSAKLAYHLKNKRNKSVLLVAGDVYRPAAISQLQTLGNQIQVPVFTEEGNTNPIDIATKAVKEAKMKGFNVVIVDTAGRLAVDEQMMNEISGLKSTLNPHETLFVVDSMTGQRRSTTAWTLTVWCSPSSMATPEAVRPLPSAIRCKSLSNLLVSARRWRHSMCSTPTVWPAVFWAWATLFRW